MRCLTGRPVRLVSILFSFLCLLTAAVRADLVWSAETGWRVEGGALSGLAGAEGRKALDLMNKARRNEEGGHLRSAIKAYNNVSKRYPNSIYAPEALYRVGQLELKRHGYVKAFDAYQQVLSRYPNTRRFNEIVGEQYRIASALLDGARGRILWGLLPGFRQREKSIEFFETVVGNAPYSDYAPLSLMNVARGYIYLKESAAAIDALDRLINNYPHSVLTPDAYMKIAQTYSQLVDGPYYDQAATKEAITYFTDYMLLYPGDNNIGNAEQGLDGMKTMLAESKIKIGDFYFYKRSNFKAARVFYNEAITAYPESKIANSAKAKLAELEVVAAKNAPPAEGAAPAPAKKKRFWFF
ncbi:tetratricopeptide repeat protein [Opitutus sp. ER46]|uniref:tetratricopeptide repeat protein n=1 Tax=Opitutus sp. ER46 TaxID=2161864 RepID=UPI000D32751E|nr:tetratricopeptide repeat protein [Opitutus sp. ER46]PTX91162.1 outer membrane protein assembly factor BamD [Opitutus sp. ER46]